LMTRIVSWLLFVCILGVFGLVCLRALKARAEARRGMPEYSVYSEDRDGLAPAAAVLEKLGYEPVALTRPIQHTAEREATNCLLILAEPARSGLVAGRESDLGEIDAQGLLNWGARGNTLLFCCRLMTDLHHGLRSGGGFWGYLHYHGQLWVLLLLVMVGGMTAWAVGVRLGKAVPTVQEQRADAVDYASAVARIYQRAGVRHLLAQSLCRDF